MSSQHPGLPSHNCGSVGYFLRSKSQLLPVVGFSSLCGVVGVNVGFIAVQAGGPSVAAHSVILWTPCPPLAGLCYLCEHEQGTHLFESVSWSGHVGSFSSPHD